MTTSKTLNPPATVKTGVSLAFILLQEFTRNFHAVLPADKLQKLEADVLPQALVLDAEYCAEKTVFAVATTPNLSPEVIAFQIK
jgi:hypothetical protein